MLKLSAVEVLALEQKRWALLRWMEKSVARDLISEMPRDVAGTLGFIAIPAVAWILSENRQAISWRTDRRDFWLDRFSVGKPQHRLREAEALRLGMTASVGRKVDGTVYPAGR